MILFMLMALLFCAAGTRIADINQQPRKFHNQIVTVSGTVTNLITLPILKVGIFQIDDGTGKIWVRPKQDTPYMNERIIVTGKLKVGISIGGKDFGVIIFESDDEE
jgi:hypothetical protein